MTPVRRLTLLEIGNITVDWLWRLMWALLLSGLIMWGLSLAKGEASGSSNRATTITKSVPGRAPLLVPLHFEKHKMQNA
jgi:hypothetical protein